MAISSENANFWDNRIKEESFNKLTRDNCPGLAGNEQYLIVTADDFGYDARRDEGILESFTKGIVTRTSLLVNGASAKTTAVQLAKQNNLPLGLHINLSEGKPVCDVANSCINTLTNADSGLMRGKFGLRSALANGEIDMNDVKNEVDAQIKTFIQLVGTTPNHVDGHQHVHVLPGVRETIAELMQAYSIYQIRIPLETYQPEWFDSNVAFYQTVYEDAKEAMSVYARQGIRFPNNFFGNSLMGKFMNLERIMDAICKPRQDEQSDIATFCEFMVHPGYACKNGIGGCGDGPDIFACSLEREHEASVLQSAELKKTLCENGLILIH